VVDRFIHKTRKQVISNLCWFSTNGAESDRDAISRSNTVDIGRLVSIKLDMLS